MPRITALPPMTDPIADGDEFPLHDVSAGDTKKSTFTKLKEYLQSLVGWVSSENLVSTVVFHVYRNAAWNFNGSSQTKIQFDTELYDAGSNFDSTTNYRFNAPVDGYYFFSARSGGDSTSRRAEISLWKNGTPILTGTSFVSTFSGSVVSGIIQLAANDYVEVYYLSDATDAGATGSSGSYLTGYLIGTE